MTATTTSDEEVFAFPASFAEQRLWFLDQVDPLTAVYNVAQGLRLEGPLDLTVLERCLREVIARHEALRTTFAAQDGVPLQIVAPEIAFELRVEDVRAHPEREAEALRLANAEAQTAFDLAKGPLIRALAVVLAPDVHVLVLNVHHIICDGSSLALLFREVSQLYPAFLANKPSPLPEVATQYADFALWQREWLEGAELERSLAFWKPVLGGTLPILELPGDRGRPPMQSFAGGSHRFFLTPTLTSKLNALARQEGASLFMTLLAAYNVLLGRLSTQDEVLVGTPIANRDRAEIEQSIGFYTNTVVFRTSLASGSFRELLQRVKKNAMEVLAHQDIPFEKVVEAVRPPRATSHNPIFQSMFGLQKAPEGALQLPGVKMSAIDVHSGTSKFDLTIDMQETNDAMQGLMEYSSDLFDRSTAERIARHFVTLLEGIAAAPDSDIFALPLLDPSERDVILRDWNATSRPFPPCTVHELFAQQVGRAPNAVAIDFEGTPLTYAELDRKSTALACHLRELGVRDDVLVAIAMNRNPDMLVAMLGVLKAGGGYVPLDPAYPTGRIAYMLEDSKAKIVITESELRDDLPLEDESVRVIAIDEWDSIAKAQVAPIPPPSPESRAYVIYTSGSTGKPKGVELPHRAVVNFLTTMAERPGLGASDRLLAVTTLSFDIAVLELLLPLTVGATIVLASRDTATDARALLDVLVGSNITVMQATPATWRMLIAEGWERGERPPRVLCGGEAMPKELALPLLERASEVWNMYGPTETTVWSTCARIEDPDDITIGKPIANTQVYVLDAAMAPVPIGVTGDLYIGGAGVARGYLDRPELTEERFVPDPFSKNGRMYKTGDQARFTSNGNLHFLGRADTQVKLRGFRIELGEIEAALAQYEDVRQAVVAVRSDGSGDTRLVAYATYTQGTSPPTPSELRKHLRQSLPDHMIPHLFVELPAMPLTQNGKVDRKALPDPFTAERRAVENANAAEPTTENEKIVAEIWRDVLKVPSIGLHDNFFDLGGHSLLSMQVIHRIAARTGHRLDPRSMVFNNLQQISAECDRA